MTSRIETATLVAMGLTALLFPGPLVVSDVRLLSHGRIHLWPGWDSASPEHTALVARFLSHRPNELAEDVPLLASIAAVLRGRNDFAPVDATGDVATSWQTAFQLVPGAHLEDRLAEWFTLLDKHVATQKANGAPQIHGDADVELRSGNKAFRIPAKHVPRRVQESLALQTSEAPAQWVLQREALLALARSLDGFATNGPGLYEKVGIEQFLDRFVAADGRPVRTFHAGCTQLAVAPTGAGKSVFARLAALQLASAGTPVALVVPDIQTAWKETRRLQGDAAAAGLRLRIVALSSWRNIAERTAAYLEHPPVEDPDGTWVLREVGYTCHLSAYVEGVDSVILPGQEPCTQLRQSEGGSKKERRVSCPFNGQCGRFNAFANAPTADILVVNHHAFLAGRAPIPFEVDGGPPRSLSTAELVFRRCGVVFIDEVDALQNAAIGANSRGLELSSRGRLSIFHNLYNAAQGRIAENRVESRLHFERSRSALLRIMHEAERLSELINLRELDWPERGRLIWRGSHDAWVATRLFGEDERAIEQVYRLFQREPIADDPSAERLRVALAPLGPGLGDGTPMVDVLTHIRNALDEWPIRCRRRSRLPETKAQLANRLIVRAVLRQLDQALGHLRPQLPAFEQLEIPYASQLRDSLLGYAPWQPSPVGPLGTRLFGYAFSSRAGEQGALETRILSGDPHGLLRELGGLVATSLTGRPRVVVGLSATCRFRGSPRADVLGALAGWVQDDARTVRVHGAGVEARISGIGNRAERIDAAREAARDLWNTQLSAYLERKREHADSAGRARALLVTGSYDEAQAVADGLRQAARRGFPIRYLVPDSNRAKSDPDALPRLALESFGQVPAPAVLIAPLSVVARGHNILQAGTKLSALSGIFVLTRPVPPSHDAERFLAHIAYNALLARPEWRGAPGQSVEAERRQSWRRLHALQRSPATFRHMDPELRRELVCDVLVELAQLAGRARRGGTPVDLVFVDGAFNDEVVPWRGLIREVLAWWREMGWWKDMVALHGAFVVGLAQYAGVEHAEY